MHSIFTPQSKGYVSALNSLELLIFKKLLMQEVQSNLVSLELTENEIEQLSWLQVNTELTPQLNQTDNKLNAEITRSLIRLHCLQLIKRGDHAAYEEFTQSQPDNKLGYEEFKQLHEEFSELNHIQQECIRKSCFITVSAKAKEVLQTFNLPNDSELFLSTLAEKFALQSPEINGENFPILGDLTREHAQIFADMYFKGLHFRHLMYTEGNDPMTKTLTAAVANQSELQVSPDINVWHWRWLVNLFAFDNLDKGSKYYTAEVHKLAEKTYAHIEKVLVDADYNYIEHYLAERAADLQLHRFGDQLNTDEKLFVAHLAAMHNVFNLVDAADGIAVGKAYLEYKQHNPNQRLAVDYAELRKTDLPTPTYVPAILNNAVKILLADNVGKLQAIEIATKFMCEFQANIFKLLQQKLQNKNHDIINCFAVAKMENLKPILAAWQDNQAIEFNLDEKNNLTCNTSEVVRLKFGK